MGNADDIIARLGLVPLPREGGFYTESYRSQEGLPGVGGKSLSTAIYYLLTPECHSALHRLPSDEIWHFYHGDPVEMLLLPPEGGGEVLILGTDLASGARPQVVVPSGTWQGARLVSGGQFALMGTTVSPGFDFEDYEAGDPVLLAGRYPEFARAIYGLGT